MVLGLANIIFQTDVEQPSGACDGSAPWSMLETFILMPLSYPDSPIVLSKPTLIGALGLSVTQKPRRNYAFLFLFFLGGGLLHAVVGALRRVVVYWDLRATITG